MNWNNLSPESAVQKANILTPEHQKALGALAAFGETRWKTVRRGLHLVLPRIYLGATPKGYVDSLDTPISEAGFVFVSGQAAHGWTGIRARPLANCTVEAAQLDAKTGQLRWAAAPRHSQEVTVAVDTGRLQEVPSREWASSNLGNPGVRAGIIRLCDEHDQMSHYALTAEFAGEPDEWQVIRTVTEVEQLR